MKLKKIIKKIIPTKFKNKIYERELNIIRAKIRNTECQYKVYFDDSKKLDGKIAIVTGGSGAIGSAICLKLAMEGATVIVTGRNVDNLNSVVEQIKTNNGKAEFLKLDVTNYEDIEKGFEYIVKKYGKIDILVNNAGGSARDRAKEIVEQDIKIIEEILDINLKGSILCSKKAAYYMKKNKYGKIINIGSVVGTGGLRRLSDYCAAKSGIIGFTKSLAMELAKYNISVNCVSPGITSQIIWDKSIDDIKTNKNYTGKIGKTDDVANAVEFFCRDESSYIIGQNLIVDGGRNLGLKNE